MLAAAFFAGLLIAPGDSPRFRQTLENGVRVSAESISAPGQASVVMAVSLAGVKAAEGTHGWPHLIEHLAARGPAGEVDKKLERLGMTLTAFSSRDSICFQISGASDQIPFAAATLKDIATSFEPTAEQVAAEVKILEEEMALEAGAGGLSRAAWTKVFGEAGLDSLGSSEAIRKATPNDLKKLFSALFTGRNLSISAAGDLDPKACATTMARFFEEVPPGSPFEAPLRSAAISPLILEVPGTGEARAALTEGLDSTNGLALLGAALLVRYRSPEAGFAYTPSLWRSLVILSGRSGQAFDDFDRLAKQDREAYAPEGLQLLRAYLLSQRRSPASLAAFSAQVSLQNPTLTLDRLIDLAKSIKPSQFGDALESFNSKQALIVRGVK